MGADTEHHHVMDGGTGVVVVEVPAPAEAPAEALNDSVRGEEEESSGRGERAGRNGAAEEGGGEEEERSNSNSQRRSTLSNVKRFLQRRGTKLPGMPSVKGSTSIGNDSQIEYTRSTNGHAASEDDCPISDEGRDANTSDGVDDAIIDNVKTMSLSEDEGETANTASEDINDDLRAANNEEDDSTEGSPSTKDGDDLMLHSRLLRLEALLDSDHIDLPSLRDAVWSGLVPRLRPMCWRVLLGYVPQNRDRRQGVLARKRAEYLGWVKTYFTDIEDEQRTEDELRTLRQIRVDVPRTAPNVSFFHKEAVQASLTRILYVRAIRNPASGYVQGINDLVTPFLAVFLSEFCIENNNSKNGGTPTSHRTMDMDSWDVSTISEKDMYSAEADCFWCLGRLIDQIQDHYTFAQPGIQKMVFRVRELVRRIDAPVADHLEEQGVEFLQFTFRWINCLLVREIPFHLTPRLWDTYIAEGSDFSEYLVYACAAFLLTWSKELLQLELEDLVMLLQHPKTSNWGKAELEIVLSRAHMWRTMFKNSSSHMNHLAV